MLRPWKTPAVSERAPLPVMQCVRVVQAGNLAAVTPQGLTVFAFPGDPHCMFSSLGELGQASGLLLLLQFQAPGSTEARGSAPNNPQKRIAIPRRFTVVGLDYSWLRDAEIQR